MSDAQVRTQAERWVEAPVDASFAALNGWLAYAAGALRTGRTTPLDFLEDAAEWWRAATVRTKPEWVTRYRTTKVWPEARLMDFSTSTDGVPTLMLPPQAGHASTIVDYSPDQSQVRTARDAGLENIHVIGWEPATPNTSESSIDRFVQILDEAVEQLGGRVNLIGDCQGGWLAAIYAAVRPESVHSIAVGGAPIDFHAGSSAIQEWVRKFSGSGELAVYRALVELGGGNHLGINQIRGFKMLEPPEEFARLAGLWGNIQDPKYVQRHIDFTNWFEWGQDVPGAFYLWIVEHLFIRNELVNRQLVVDGQVVDLGRITAPLFMLAGTNDHITPAEQMFALGEHVSTPKAQQHEYLVEAGHLGLFMGHTALDTAWSEVCREMAQLPESEPENAEVVQAEVVDVAEVAVPADELEMIAEPTLIDAPAATPAAEQGSVTRTVAKKAPVKKSTAPKPTEKKAPAEKPAAKKAPAKKSSAKKSTSSTPSAAKKAPAAKSTSTKSTSTKGTAKAAQAPAEKSEAKKTAAEPVNGEQES